MREPEEPEVVVDKEPVVETVNTEKVSKKAEKKKKKKIQTSTQPGGRLCTDFFMCLLTGPQIAKY